MNKASAMSGGSRKEEFCAHKLIIRRAHKFCGRAHCREWVGNDEGIAGRFQPWELGEPNHIFNDGIVEACVYMGLVNCTSQWYDGHCDRNSVQHLFPSVCELDKRLSGWHLREWGLGTGVGLCDRVFGNFSGAGGGACGSPVPLPTASPTSIPTTITLPPQPAVTGSPTSIPPTTTTFPPSTGSGQPTPDPTAATSSPTADSGPVTVPPSLVNGDTPTTESSSSSPAVVIAVVVIVVAVLCAVVGVYCRRRSTTQETSTSSTAPPVLNPSFATRPPDNQPRPIAVAASNPGPTAEYKLFLDAPPSTRESNGIVVAQGAQLYTVPRESTVLDDDKYVAEGQAPGQSVYAVPPPSGRPPDLLQAPGGVSSI